MPDKDQQREDSRLDQIFGPSGTLAGKLTGYEYRPSQLRMAKAVLNAIEQQHHLCVEAGTGTGKTLAYLIPALFSRKRVIVSTATRNLQDQLFSKDIPFIRRHLLPDLSVTYMKGRQNYLCLRRLREQDAQYLPFAGVKESRRAIAEWAHHSETGDRAELEWIGDQDPLWQSLDARSEICTGQKCSYFEECFVTRMRRKAFESDLIVVNHALFFSNVALERDELGKLLPDFGVLILDEAHEIEDIAAVHFGRQLSNLQFEELSRDILRSFSSSAGIVEALSRLDRTASSFFDGFPEGEGKSSLNFYRAPGNNPVDLRLDMTSDFRDLSASLQLLFSQLQLLSDRPPEWEALQRRVDQLSTALNELFVMDDSDHVYWFDRRRRGIFLHITPIDVAGLMREHLFERTQATILTSATLTTDGTFDYLRERVGIPEPEEVMVPGEFDYTRQCMLYVPRRLPEPSSPEYFLHALREMRSILALSDGHAFLLFTSFQQMNRFYAALSQKCEFPLLRQGEMPKNRLLEVFKQTPRSVLCATSSFWQGVDVRGDALRAVIIDKLPFQVPTDPLVAARLHRLQQQGKNPFLKYTVPDAIITLKQGLGRLIRSRKDRGVLAILDSRLRTRRYGPLFLKSLPNCPLTDNMGALRNFFHKHASPSTEREKNGEGESYEITDI